MGAFRGATNFFNKSLEEIAKNLHYSEDNILILQGNENELKRKYPTTYYNMNSCKHNSDKRTPLAYAQDLIASWIIEDTFLEAFNRNGLAAKLDGADNHRQILANTKVSSSSDFLIMYNGKSRKLELMNDYTSFWTKYHKLHLRDDKFTKLKKENSLFLGVSMQENQFLLIDFEKNINATYIPSHPFYGGKPAYELIVSDKDLSDASSTLIMEAIKARM